MTLLAALWRYDGRPAGIACKAMLRAQEPPGWRRSVAVDEPIALGAAVRGVGIAEAVEAGPLDGHGSGFKLVSDARLDNRADFLPGLRLTAADAAPLSDLRVIMLCFERWGSDVISRLIGDFALVLWDARQERLLLARDYVGMRPLHFHAGPRGLAVASTVKGLHALDFVPRGVDEARLLEALASLPLDGRGTFFKGVERVEPGEVLTFRRGGNSSYSLWTPPTGEIRFRSEAECAEGLIEKLDAAVDARLPRAGATVATHLSAGLDSSAVTTSAALRFGGRVVAFTAAPPAGRLPDLPAGRFGDECPPAAATASLYDNVEHRLVSTGNRLPLEDLGWELDLFERPDLNHANMVWGNRINDAAQAEGIGVMLLGTMGNTTISYAGYEHLDLLLRQGRLTAWFAEAAAAHKAGMPARALFARAARQILPHWALGAFGRFRIRDHHPATAGVINPHAPGLADLLARWTRDEDSVQRTTIDARAGMIRRVDLGSYYKGVLLKWNLDLRDPTADRRLFEYCLQVPLSQYFRNGMPRALIRTALKGRVPDAGRLDRRRGLQSPNWFAMLSEARDEGARLLAGIEQCAAAHRVLDIPKMRRLIDNWPGPAASFGPAVYRYGLLRGLSAGEFMRIHSECEASLVPRADLPVDPGGAPSITSARTISEAVLKRDKGPDAGGVKPDSLQEWTKPSCRRLRAGSAEAVPGTKVFDSMQENIGS